MHKFSSSSFSCTKVAVDLFIIGISILLCDSNARQSFILTLQAELTHNWFSVVFGHDQRKQLKTCGIAGTVSSKHGQACGVATEQWQTWSCSTCALSSRIADATQLVANPCLTQAWVLCHAVMLRPKIAWDWMVLALIDPVLKNF